MTDIASYASLLRYCTSFGSSLPRAVKLHRHLIRHGRHRHSFLGNLLVRMYGKLGSLRLASQAFQDISAPDGFSWNLLISACSSNGSRGEALCAYACMRAWTSFAPDKCTLLPLLSGPGTLAEGKEAHANIVALGFDLEVTLQTALVGMYAKQAGGRSFEEAGGVFEGMCERDTVAWTAMIAACVWNNRGGDAVADLFVKMSGEGIKPDEVTLLVLLDACVPTHAQTHMHTHTLAYGKAVHARAVACGLVSGIAVQSALLSMYGRCGCVHNARAVFNRMPTRDVVAWTSMIAAHAHNQESEEALELFHKMEMEGITPNKITFLNALEACTNPTHADAIRARAYVHGLGSDVEIGNALLSVYAKCDCLGNARQLFDRMAERNLVSWNAMIAAYAHNGCGREALSLFKEMELEGKVKPDKITFLGLLNACTSMGSLEDGREIHKCLLSSSTGFESDITLHNSLLHMYGKCDDGRGLQEACIVFNGMGYRDSISWNTMITMYSRTGHVAEALQLFLEMESEGVKPDKVTFLNLLNACAGLGSSEKGRAMHALVISKGCDLDASVETALLSMYAKCGGLEEACLIFDGMPQEDAAPWNAMIVGYVRNGHSEEALSLFSQMVSKGVNPDKITFVCLLNACISLESLENGRVIHNYILGSGLESEVAVKTALLNMYGKCGSIEEAREVFDGMHQLNAISWNAMLTSYTECGRSMEALELFQQMDLGGVKPDKVTFLCLLNACGSLALVENGRRIHQIMQESGLELDIALKTALIDMYGKCGSLMEAQMVFDGIHRPDLVSWNSMFGVFAQNGHAKDLVELFQQMDFEGVKPDKATYICLLNACNHAGLWEEGWCYFISMTVHHGITPLQEHYVCMIDILGRAGCLNETEDMAQNMPIVTNSLTWGSLLGAYQIHGDVERAAS